MQIGVLLLDFSRSFVHDNVVRAGDRPPTERLLEDLEYRARMRRNLLANVGFGAMPPQPTNASVTLFGHVVNFRTLPDLTSGNRNANQWQAAARGVPAGAVSGPHALFRRLEEFADRALLGLPSPSLTPTIRRVARDVLQQDEPTGSQGIVVGGSRADDVQVINNTIENVLAGIHIGVSHDAPSHAAPDSIGTAVISQNTIRIRVASAATRERHGVFVGNFRSLQVTNNTVSAVRSSVGTFLTTDGIRVYGHAGPRMTIRDNHLERFDVGIVFVARVLPAPKLWVITHNLAVNAAETVRAHRRVGRVLTPIRAHIRGIADNAP